MQSPAKLLAGGMTALLILGALIGMFMWAAEKNYSPLMTNLNPEDAANIIRILREKHIPFKLDQTGKNISIPPESLYQLRLELATMGLPQSSVIGYEIFDKQSLGTTTYVQKINQKRALEGELMRTINQIRGVRRSRIHLAIPQKSTFVEDQKKSTASVVLDLDPGTVLNEKQVYGIGNLVARAVEGMDVSDVVIVDASGKTLSKNSSDSVAGMTNSQHEYQQKLEEDMEKRIEALLGRVVGEGHVAAKVTADLDFSQINETQTIYDADSSAVLSVEKRNDQANAVRPGPYGAAGAVSNSPGQTPTVNNEIKTDTVKTGEVVNYQVPQTVRRTTRQVGTIKRLSVAVVVDGKQVKTTGQNGAVESKVEAWTPEKLKEFDEIVASAVGIDRKRGDSLEIKNMEFSHEDFEEGQRIIAEKERKAYIQNIVFYGVIGLLVILFFVFVIRPFVKWFTDHTVENVDAFLPKTIEELEQLDQKTKLPNIQEVIPVLPEKRDPEKIEGEMLKERIVTLIEANPQKAALILKDWLPLKGSDSKDDGGTESRLNSNSA